MDGSDISKHRFLFFPLKERLIWSFSVFLSTEEHIYVAKQNGFILYLQACKPTLPDANQVICTWQRVPTCMPRPRLQTLTCISMWVMVSPPPFSSPSSHPNSAHISKWTNLSLLYPLPSLLAFFFQFQSLATTHLFLMYLFNAFLKLSFGIISPTFANASVGLSATQISLVLTQPWPILAMHLSYSSLSALSLMCIAS